MDTPPLKKYPTITVPMVIGHMVKSCFLYDTDITAPLKVFISI